MKTLVQMLLARSWADPRMKRGARCLCRVAGGAEQGWPPHGALVLSSSGAERGPEKAVLGHGGEREHYQCADPAACP